MKDIEQFLRESKPQTPAEDNFIIEMNARLDAVEGIKSTVAEERRRGRRMMLAALGAGLILGGLVAAVLILHPALPEAVGGNTNPESFIGKGLTAIRSAASGFQTFLKSAPQALSLLIAALAITLGLVALKPRRR